jgi:glucosamine-6-phosphate deaminase
MNYGKTRVVICEDELDLGMQAAHTVALQLRSLLKSEDEVRMIVAAGESQSAFLNALANEPDVEWDRVVCFNMDDFWDTRIPEQFTCGYQTRTQLYDKVHPRRYHLIQFDAPDPDEEARRFESLLRAMGRIDILCQGIGTSGHLALNEPHQTDFNDPSWVKVVDTAEQSKRQLVEDPNFSGLGYIPSKGITMTIPALLNARHVYTMVPLALKRSIMTKLFDTHEPTTDLPASILRDVDSVLFLDRDSCPNPYPTTEVLSSI